MRAAGIEPIDVTAATPTSSRSRAADFRPAWLTKDRGGEVRIITTGNAENPLRLGHVPLLTCDVWEHDYYIDHRNDRGAYLKDFWELVNWDFVAGNLAK